MSVPELALTLKPHALTLILRSVNSILKVLIVLIVLFWLCIQPFRQAALLT
jgi:chromosome condensin MukBEF MukE localization factor